MRCDDVARCASSPFSIGFLEVLPSSLPQSVGEGIHVSKVQPDAVKQQNAAFH